MAKIVERDGKSYCVEEDGTEWEYAPAHPSLHPKPEDMIAKLESENSDLWYDLMLKEMVIQQHDLDISELYYITMTGGA